MTSYLTSDTLDSSGNIIKYNGNCTHAYVLTRQGMQRVLNTWEKALYKDEMDLDLYYKKLFSNYQDNSIVHFSHTNSIA